MKGAVAISGNRIFVGDYSGHLYALSYASGKVLWKAKLQPRFGGAGNFYATPSAAYGRVYVGATDGKVYSFGAESGKLRWSQSTGGYVYSSTAVWHDRVYAGSYSKRFFCFDAATGKILWQFKANGQISGVADRDRGPRVLRHAGGPHLCARRALGRGCSGRSPTASTRRSSRTRSAST